MRSTRRPPPTAAATEPSRIVGRVTGRTLRARVAALGLVLALALAPAGCDSDADTEPEPVSLDWQAVELPVPPGPEGRLAVRDATVCGDAWVLVGGVFMTSDRSRPAVWSSADGRSWTSLPVAPKDYWAKRSVLTSVACREDGSLAMIGGKSGGAHGNPRVSSWYQREDGVFVDVIAGYTLYGGAEATNVSRIAAGPDGFLITGNRVSGAAVWTSPDARGFELHDDVPELTNGADRVTLAIGQVHDGERWTVVGSASLTDRLARVPMAWTSPDGLTWTDEDVPRTDDFNDLEQVAAVDNGLVALGLRGQAYGVWTRDADGRWELGETFGAVQTSGGSPAVSSLVSLAGGDGDERRLLASVADGETYQLWSSTAAGAWTRVSVPLEPEVGSERSLSVAARGQDVLLVADDGANGRVWLATWP
jgi:hypothetical protein